MQTFGRIDILEKRLQARLCLLKGLRLVQIDFFLLQWLEEPFCERVRNAFRFIQGLLCHPCAIERDKNGLVGDRTCWPVRFSMRVEEEQRRGQRVEHLDRDTAEKPAMSATQTMRCHCHQGNVVLLLRIRHDLGCRVSIQNLRLYV